MSNFTHWFYIYHGVGPFEAGGYWIITGAVGNHPVGKHWYDDKEELEIAIKSFESDGYKNMGYRS